MKNIFEPQLNIPKQEIQKESKLGDYEAFRKQLEENMKEVRPEEIEKILVELERYSQSPDRPIEIYTDPELDTFCCGQVPAKSIGSKGEIIDNPKRKFDYLIGVPFIYVAGKAPKGFLCGEILHEKGHAERTDFLRMKKFEILARKEGYDPQELLQLDNCIEDPRMERLVGGPLNENERKLLFEKNSKLIIPNIAEGIKGKNGKKMSPTDQFKFIVKLERLWALHKKDLADTEKPWSLDDLHPRVKEEYERIEPILAQITGDAVKPSMKISTEVEKLIVDNIWPALKRLIDEFPAQEGEGKGKGKGGGKGKRGQPSQGGTPEQNPNLDPNDPSSWPPELQKIFQKMKEKHEKRLREKAEKAKQESEKKESEAKRLEKEKHELLKTKDGFEDPALREKYNQLKSEVAPAIRQLKRIFQRFLPKVDEPQFDWGRKGIRFDVKRYVRKIGTGHEEPLGRRKTPEKNALVLQILVDVSGSMYDGKRINNAVKACIAICEAAQDHNIVIEILANDEGNINEGSDRNSSDEYLIKGFNDSFDGRTKSNVAKMLEKFGGSNEDADAIRAALPRLRKQVQKMRSGVDRIGSLMIYISDSTTQSIETKQAADEAKRVVPFEGTAITSDGDIPAMVKYHFGSESIIPKSIDDFPIAIQEILQRHIANLKARE